MAQTPIVQSLLDDVAQDIRLTPQELATVLAALRHWQHTICSQGDGAARSFPHFEAVPPLTSDEIDDLCERLNCDMPDQPPA